jgi:lipid A 3-O-deacylase
MALIDHWFGDYFMKSIFAALAAVLAASFVAPAAQAQSLTSDYNFELRGGLYGHSIDEPGSSSTFGFFNLTRIQDANVELLFHSPDNDVFRSLGSPRPTVGATLNFGGLESMAYAGLTWHANLFDSPVFIEGQFGGAALFNADLHGAVYPRRSVGCNVMFHEAVSLGYDITPQANVMFTVEHASHAYLCGDDNRGLTNMGVRLGMKF